MLSQETNEQQIIAWLCENIQVAHLRPDGKRNTSNGCNSSFLYLYAIELVLAKHHLKNKNEPASLHA
jgi:hypothetical protein